MKNLLIVVELVASLLMSQHLFAAELTYAKCAGVGIISRTKMSIELGVLEGKSSVFTLYMNGVLGISKVYGTTRSLSVEGMVTKLKLNSTISVSPYAIDQAKNGNVELPTFYKPADIGTVVFDQEKKTARVLLTLSDNEDEQIEMNCSTVVVFR